MEDQRVRPAVWLVFVGSIIALATIVLQDGYGTPPEPTKATDQVADESSPGASARSEKPVTREGRDRSAARPAARHEEQDAVPYIEGLVFGDIDLREARELMPDNLYWTLGAPTKDPQVLAERDQEKERRNQEYGRVLSGDASEEEVRAYYDYRRRLSSDYVEFAEFMQRRFKGKGPDEFQGMLDLALKLNAERLAQIPADEQDALERARERARIREEWQRQQADFAGVGEGPGGDRP
jgi:hypothetical protein